MKTVYLIGCEPQWGLIRNSRSEGLKLIPVAAGCAKTLNAQGPQSSDALLVRLKRLAVRAGCGILLLLAFQVFEHAFEIVIELRGVDLPCRSDFFDNFVLPFHCSSPISSSGVHKIGGWYPLRSTTRRIARCISALAMWRQFQVRRYSQP